MKKVILLFLSLFCSISSFSQEKLQNKFLVSVDAGIGLQVGNTNLSPINPEYSDEYKNGVSANLKVLYLLNKRIGIGLKYNYWGASGRYDLVGGEVKYKDNVSIHYIAPQFELKTPLTNSLSLINSIGIGFMCYKNKADLFRWKMSTNSFAANIDMMLDYKITHQFSVRLGASYLNGNYFKKVRQTADGVESSSNWEKYRRIKIHRIDFLIGVIGRF